MNVANWLTLSRIVLIIPFVYFLLNDYYLIALIIFVIASITDWLDGFIARKFNMITDLGKLLDPMADKILVISALICFAGYRGNDGIYWFPAWVVPVIIIVAREFIVTGFRMAILEKDNKAVIAADIWGKIKTAFTMFTIIVILALLTLEKHRLILSATRYWFNMQGYGEGFISGERYLSQNVGTILIYICATLTVFSGITMIWKNRKLFTQ